MKEKIIYLEILRVICAIVVVLDHVCIAGIHIFEKGATVFDRFLYNGIQHWSHFAVPVFLMITGYLLLDSKKEIGYKKAITKYVWRMVAILLTVGTVFAWMEIYFSTKSLAPYGLLTGLWNTIQGDTWDHLWYLYTLIGLYLVLPILKPLFDKLSKRELDTFLMIFFFFGSVMPAITSFTNFKCGVTLPICSIYLFYFLIGRRIGIEEKKPLSMKKSTIIFIFLTITLFTCSYFEYYHAIHELECLSIYSSPIVVLAGVLLFYIMKNLDTDVCQKLSTMGGGKTYSSAYCRQLFWNIYFPHAFRKHHIQSDKI